ncbi:hypothetical protein P8452_24952 [Trifolium repens]|nr:hypothetical protein P8452_24952 [Trifolium repens]
MSDLNPLLGFATEQHVLARDELDQKERSTKRAKDGARGDGGGCPEKVKVIEGNKGVSPHGGASGATTSQIVEGAWTVVHKTRRPRKGKEGVSPPQSTEGQNHSEKQALKSTTTGSRFALLTMEDEQEVTRANNTKGVTSSDVGLPMQSLSHNDVREKNNTKTISERSKGHVNNNKSKKFNATRVTFKDKTGPTVGKNNDTLENLMATNAFDTFIATHCNSMHKKETVPTTGNTIQCSVQHEQHAGKQSIGHDSAAINQEMEVTHLNYHREPGLTESDQVHRPMPNNNQPVLEPALSLPPKSNGDGSVEVEVFVDTKENGELSTEEWDMDTAGEGGERDNLS